MSSRSRKIQRQSVTSSASPSPSSSGQASPAINSNLPLPNQHEITSSSLSNNLIKSTINPTSMNQISQTSIHLSSPPGGSAQAQLNYTKHHHHHHNPPSSTSTSGSNSNPISRNPSGPNSTATTPGGMPSHFNMIHSATTSQSHSGASTPSTSGIASSNATSVTGGRRPVVLETNHLQLKTHEASGRRMINQYIIEDELGRGVHGKVRLARDTDTGEKVAVKIVEREGRKRLGGGAVGNWGRGATLGRERERERRSEKETRQLENQSSIPSNSTDLKGKGKESATDSDHHREESEKPFQGQINNDNPPASPKSPATRFAPAPSTPTKSPGSSSLSGRASTQAAAALAGRYGRWGGGTPSRPTYADKELEKAEKAKEKERTKRSMLWTTDKKVKREIAIMKKCCHENVVMLKEVIDDPQSKKIFMVLEYMEGGEVQWKDIRGFPTMTISEARQTVRDVVCGLEYLHYQGIIHRDIKPANLLWDSSRRVKISDFGVSHFSYSLLVAGGGLPTHSSSGSSGVATKDPSLVDDHELAKTAGSPAFFAPELCLSGESIAAPPSTVSSTRNTPAALSESPRSKEFPFPAAPLTKISKSEAALPNRRTIPGPAPRDRKLPITKAIDIWALGVTLYCLLFGHPPFTAESEYALFSVISNEDYTLPTWMGADRVKVGPRAPRWKELKQWTDEEGDVAEEEPHDPDAREEDLPEEARLLRDLLDRLLDKDPATRIKLEEVKTHPWVTRDLEAPDAWLDETDIQKHPFVEISHEDVEGALTGFSKMKRTFKNLRHKIIESFVGHHHHHREGLGPDGLVLGRKRSKSASHLQPFDLTPMSSNLSGSTAHQIIHSSPRSAGVNVMHHSVPLTPVAIGGTVKAPKTPSHRPGFFFRRQSSVIPSEKSLKAGARNLTYVASSEGTPGRRVNGQGSISAKESRSQPATRSSSPILTETEGSVSAEAKLRKISAQASSQQSPPPSGNFPWIVSSLLPSDAAAAAQRSTKPSIYQRRSSARSDLLVSKEPTPTPIETASPALNRSSSDSPTSSRLITRESLASANHPLERVDTSGRRSQDTDTGRWSTASGSIAHHQSSRSRLGDLFRGVWSNGSSSPRSSRKSRSRPGTAASRGAPPSSFREPIGKASMDSLSQHGSSSFHRASNQEVFASKSVSSSPFAHAPPPLTVDAIGASTSVGPRPARDSPSSAPLPWNDRLRFSSAQGQGGSDSSSRSVSPQDAFSARQNQALNEPQRIDLETDDVDLDLEFSDDDLDENVRGGRIRGIKNDGSGWRSDTGRGSRGGLGPRNPNGFDSGGVSTDDERHGGSPYRSGPESSEGLTPSVEGGYNLFKPPYTGIVHHSSSGDERDSIHSHPQVTAAPYSSSSIPPNNAYAIGDDSEAAALRRGMGASETVDPNSPSLQPSPSNWNDRFADADETAVLPQPRPISASGSQSQTTAALNTEVDSGFVNATLKHDQRGEVRDDVKDYGDGQDGYESEGDGGVSFEIRKKSA